MKILTLRVPSVQTQPQGRPEQCPHCGSPNLHRHGTGLKPIKDHQIRQVVVHRYKCARCRRTFRHYPEGVGRPDQSRRLIVLAALAWTLGLSTRSIERLFELLGVRIGKSTAWRDVQAVCEGLKRRLQNSGRSIPVLGLDGTGIPLRGQASGIVVAVDLGSGQPVGLAQIPEGDVEALVAWLRPLVQAYGVEVIVTDEHPAYGVVSEVLGLQHGHCLFHLRRRVGRQISALEAELGEGVHPLLAQVKQILEELPPDGGQRLFHLALGLRARFDPRKKIQSSLYRLKQFILRLSDHWRRYRLWLLRSDVPPTNNRTEAAIGRLKMRARTVRGFKTWAGVEAALLLTCALPA